MTAALKNSLPVVGSFTCLHHNCACRQIGYMSGQLTPSQAFLMNGLAGSIGAVELKGVYVNANMIDGGILRI
jgi:hypothetical protein